MPTLLSFEFPKLSVLHQFLKPRRASSPSRLQKAVHNASLGLRDRLSSHVLVAAIGRQPAQLAQGVLVLVQQAADGEVYEVGVLAGALVPGRQLGAAVA